jgi:hypothetical protein
MESSLIKPMVKKLNDPVLDGLYSFGKALKTGCIVAMFYYGYTKWEEKRERKKLVTKRVETDGNYKLATGNNFFYSCTGYLNLWQSWKSKLVLVSL